MQITQGAEGKSLARAPRYGTLIGFRNVLMMRTGAAFLNIQ